MERRKSDRFVSNVRVFYKIDLKSPWIGPVRLEDISGHGMKFATSQILRKDALLNIKIELPDGKNPIIFSSVVAWCQPSLTPSFYSTGVKFSKMQIDDRRRFVKYACASLLDQALDNDGELNLK